MEIIASTIAAVFEPLGSAPSINERDVAAVMKRPLAVGQTADGQFMVSSNRDQAEVMLELNRLDVRDLSGKVATAKNSIPPLLGAFLGFIANPHVKSFGINFVIEFYVVDAQQVLAKRFLRPGIIKQVGSGLISDSVSYQFQHPCGKKWTLRFRTRDNEAILVNFNSSEEVQNSLDIDALGDQLETQHGLLVEYVNLLGLVPND